MAVSVVPVSIYIYTHIQDRKYWLGFSIINSHSVIRLRVNLNISEQRLIKLNSTIYPQMWTYGCQYSLAHATLGEQQPPQSYAAMLGQSQAALTKPQQHPQSRTDSPGINKN